MKGRLNYIAIFSGLYIISIALYMAFNNTKTPEVATLWKNYYWIVNKSAMLMALIFNYKKDKTRVDWLFINFLTIQTILIIIYFCIGLPYFYSWMVLNDAVIYSFVIGGFIAVLAMWLHTISNFHGLKINISNWFRTTFWRAKK